MCESTATPEGEYQSSVGLELSPVGQRSWFLDKLELEWVWSRVMKNETFDVSE